ncbi:MAG TPA: hypothetical protein VFV01_15695 [Spirillospora sp.]|nr:hypothetical protein [Spirillospora sp.]
MRRTPSFLAATALAASALLVPTTAHADVTDAKLTVAFDRLAADRVAGISLSVKSASGVTNVTAHLRYQSSTADPYATLQLTRTQGTDSDGVWKAEYRPDITVRPGGSVVDTVITTADRATTTRRAGFLDCYTTTIEGLTGSPSVVDADHPDTTLRGRLMFRKSRDEAAEPAAGAEVSAAAAKAATGADGSFALQVRGAATVYAYAQGPLCYTEQKAPVTVTKQATVTTATITPASSVGPFGDVRVRGKVVRQGPDGPVPVAGMEIAISVPSDLADFQPVDSKTGADGTFSAWFQAGTLLGASGAVTVATRGDQFLDGNRITVGPLTIRRVSAFSGFDVGPAQQPYGDPINAQGRLSIQPDPGGTAKSPVFLEYSLNGKTGWTVWEKQTLEGQGGFYSTTGRPVTADAYWRLRYPGDALTMAAVSQVKHVDVKYRTYIYNFNASPEPVKKGKTITVKGLLDRFMDKAVPGPNAPVSIYFKPSGSSKWSQVAVVKTASNGWFSKTFKASQDGTWMASYNGSANYFASNKPSDYVDVR